jgi:hypothetical protein
MQAQITNSKTSMSAIACLRQLRDRRVTRRHTNIALPKRTIDAADVFCVSPEGGVIRSVVTIAALNPCLSDISR